MIQEDTFFKGKDFKFSYRIGGVIYKDNKVLLQKNLKGKYVIIGGHSNILEDSKTTIIREFKEEINADIQVDSLLAIGEVFWIFDGVPCHTITLIYKVSLKDDNTISESPFLGNESFNGHEFQTEFAWLDFKELKGNMLPEELIPIIIAKKDEVTHFVSWQL